MILAAIEDNLVSSSSTAIDISSKVTILDAIRFLARSWRLVKMETIANCFHKGGFQVCSEDQPMEEPEDQPAWPEVINSDSYLHIDDEAPCHTDNDSIEDEIVEAFKSKKLQQQDDPEDDDEPGDPRVTHAAARHSVQLLQRYFTEQGFSDKLHCALDMCADQVLKKAFSAMKQSTLDQAFHVSIQ